MVRCMGLGLTADLVRRRGRLAPSALVTNDADGLLLRVDALLDTEGRVSCKPPRNLVRCRGRLAPSALVTDDADGLSLRVEALDTEGRISCKPPKNLVRCRGRLAPSTLVTDDADGLSLRVDALMDASRGTCEPPAAALAPAPARGAPYAGLGSGQSDAGSCPQRALAEPGPALCTVRHDAAGGGAGGWEPGSALEGDVGQDWEASLAWDDEPRVPPPPPSQPHGAPARLLRARAEPRPVPPSPGRAAAAACPIASPAPPLPAQEHLPLPLRRSAPVPARKLGTLRPSNATTGPSPDLIPVLSPGSSPGRGAPLRRGFSASPVFPDGGVSGVGLGLSKVSEDEGAQSLSSSMDLDDTEDARPSAQQSAGEAQSAPPALPAPEDHFRTGEPGCAGLGECAAAAPHSGTSTAPPPGQHTPVHLMAGLQDILNCVRTGEPVYGGRAHSSGSLPQVDPVAGSVPWAGTGACTGPAVHAPLNPAAQLPAQPPACYAHPVQLAAGLGPAPLPWGTL